MKKGKEMPIIKNLVVGILLMMASIYMVILVPEKVSANNEWEVDSSGGKDFLTISEALGAAQNGDTILVYVGNGYTESNVIDKSVSIIGVIDGFRPVVSRSGSNWVFRIISQGVTIRKLEIDGLETEDVWSTGIWSIVSASEENSVEIDDCIIHGFKGNGGGGIVLKRDTSNDPYPANHLIQNCMIHSNRIGVRIETDPDIQGSFVNNVVRNCEIYNNRVHGILNHGDNNYFQNLNIHHHTWGGLGNGITIQYSSGCNIYLGEERSSKIHNNSVYGISIENSNSIDITGLDSSELLVIENNSVGIRILHSDDVDIKYTNIYNNNYGVTYWESDVCRLEFNKMLNNNDQIIIESNSDGNIFSFNDIYKNDGGSEIYLHNSDSNYFDNEEKTFDGHFEFKNSNSNIITRYDTRHISMTGCSYNKVIDCTIKSFTNGTGLTITNSSNIYVNNTDIDDTGLAISVEDSTDIHIDGCVGSPPPDLSEIKSYELLSVSSGHSQEHSSASSTVYLSRYSFVRKDYEIDHVILQGTAQYNTYAQGRSINQIYELNIDEDAYSQWDD